MNVPVYHRERLAPFVDQEHLERFRGADYVSIVTI